MCFVVELVVVLDVVLVVVPVVVRVLVVLLGRGASLCTFLAHLPRTPSSHNLSCHLLVQPACTPCRTMLHLP